MRKINMALPAKLYKYRAFDVRTLQILSDGELYYAEPSSLNDPLDCNPGIQTDATIKDLERLCIKILTDKHKDTKVAEQEILRHRDLSTEYGDYKKDPEATYCYKVLMQRTIQEAIWAEFGKKGILALSQKWDCPLLWSHYADEHKGLCIEFNTKDNSCSNLSRVNYNQPRNLRIRDLIDWKIKGAQTAKQAIEKTFFFSKAPSWRYEKEWRDVRDEKGKYSPLQITAIYFGMRCEYTVIQTIIKLLSNSNKPIKFYKIHPKEDSFKLKRHTYDTDEIDGRSVRSMELGFDDLILK